MRTHSQMAPPPGPPPRNPYPVSMALGVIQIAVAAMALLPTLAFGLFALGCVDTASAPGQCATVGRHVGDVLVAILVNAAAGVALVRLASPSSGRRAIVVARCLAAAAALLAAVVLVAVSGGPVVAVRWLVLAF